MCIYMEKCKRGVFLGAKTGGPILAVLKLQNLGLLNFCTSAKSAICGKNVKTGLIQAWYRQ